MRILCLCHRIPYPPDKGDKIRSYHELAHLARNHEVHLMTFADSATEENYAAGLNGLCERVEVFRIDRTRALVRTAVGLVRGAPLTLSYYASRSFGSRVRELATLGSFDAVIAFSSSMAPYAQMVRGIPRILDMVDVDSAKWSQYGRFSAFPKNLLYRLEARRLREYEASLASEFDVVLVTTSEELRLLREVSPDFHAVAVRNGIDFEFHRPLDYPPSPIPSLVFTGQMDYFPNVDGVNHFAREVLPKLRRRHPELEFVIVGRSPSSRVWSLGQLPGVVVTGAVGDIRPFLGRSWVFVAPLRIAQGVQNKVLEAMAAEIPVVCTPPVMAGLRDGGLQEDRDLIVADSDEELEVAIHELLESAEWRRRIGVAGRRCVTEHYSWRSNLEQLDELLEEVAPLSESRQARSA